MKNKWTIGLGLVGLIVGLIHPSNIDFGVDMSSAIGFAIPWAIFFSVVGLVIDYFTKTKTDEIEK